VFCLSKETPQKDLPVQKKSMSERFMEKVITEYGTNVGHVALSDFQKRLAQNYFMAIDSALKMAEEKRKKKTKNQDSVAVTWANVNLEQLARDVVTFARMGLDPAQKNHIAVIPYKNNTTGKYDIGFLEEYRGLEIKARKYGLDVPDAVVVELVYSTDKFRSIKKDRNNPYESYEFEITNDFNRGEIVGGFYYHIYNDHPEKNKLVVFSLADILKRKPKNASAEFWGGEKDVWENGKKVGKEEVVGWFDKMCWKTIYRAAYNDITIDSQKIDDAYIRMMEMEAALKEAEVEAEIEENANKEAIDITEYTIVDTPKSEPQPKPEPINEPVPSESEETPY
jgi:recombination protein RecT